MLLLRFGHWQLLLRAGSPNEAAPHSHGAQPPSQLRPVPQDGDLRAPGRRTGASAGPFDACAALSPSPRPLTATPLAAIRLSLRPTSLSNHLQLAERWHFSATFRPVTYEGTCACLSLLATTEYRTTKHKLCSRGGPSRSSFLASPGRPGLVTPILCVCLFCGSILRSFPPRVNRGWGRNPFLSTVRTKCN